MSVSSEIERGTISMNKFFEQGVEDWRSKMIKVYGDQHPYMLYVTAGHDFEDLILKKEDSDAPERESRKSEPFENLKKMSEVDKKVANDFLELLSKMAALRPTPELKDTLEEKKKECAKVFEMFDQVVAVCENYFDLEYTDCCKRVSKQMTLQKPIIDEVEKFLIEVEEVGNTELQSLRDKISNWVFNKGLSMLDSISKSYAVLYNQPFAMTVWFECSAKLTSKDVRNAFLADQKEMSYMWKKAFDDLLMLSTKLEKCRCNYNLIKFKLEREIFWMNRDYKENMPELTKIQRHLCSLNDQRTTLKVEMKSLENEVKSEQKRVNEIRKKMNSKIINTKNSNKFAHQTALKRFKHCVEMKKDEIYHVLSDILKGDQFIHEEILSVHYDPIDISHLKPVETIEKDEMLEKAKTSTDIQSKSLSAAYEDGFSETFQLFKSSENFVTLLNTVADELGYILDFSWVDYIKNKLELTQKVRWLELFKVFKINFVQDLKELKEHMMPYCTFDDNGDVVFDSNGAIDGFLNFVWLKRQSSLRNVPQHQEYDAEDYKDYWASATSAIPKSLLWDSIEEILFQYWELLEARSNLLQKKFNLVEENREFENCLQNYHKYGTWCV